ncbi:MAG TPA: FHA domain-containing protein [bacterium]|nr:FHA domain-containing protein [bacterium]
MPKLIVQLKHKTVQELDMTSDMVVLIGRGDESAIKLDDSLVSREHAQIREDTGRYLVSDLGSANGTFVGARKITQDYELKDGDVIRISPYTISFGLAAFERPTQVGRMENLEKPTEVFTFTGTPRVLVRSGEEVGKSYDLTNNPLIGRDADCDITLNEATVSRKHARIQFIENKLTVVDVGSRSGTRVNGKLIDKPTQLKDGDRIQLGEASLEIEWKGGGGATKAEAEKATVPFFRPDIAPVKKEGQPWKWAVGVAAAIIVVAGAYLAFHRQTGPTTGGGKTSVLASELVKQSMEALGQNDNEKAVQFADLAWSKDSTSGSVRDQVVTAHKAAAFALENQGNPDKAKMHWSRVRALKPDDPDAMKRVGTGTTSTRENPVAEKEQPTVNPSKKPEPITSVTPYDKALATYRLGSLEDAQQMAAAIPAGDPKATELAAWIDLWQQARYRSGPDVSDLPGAAKLYGDLLQRDPANSLARAESSKLSASSWDSQKAKDLDKQAQDYYGRCKDYGDEESCPKAKALYDQIVKMGPPPASADTADATIYNRAKQRLAELS